MKNLKDILPAGISEATIAEITNLVNESIKAQVAKEVKELGAKVVGFLRLKTEEIQESALKQLEEGNETYRNAKLFEHIRSIMAVEVASPDYDLPLSNLVEENKQLEATVDELSSELSKVMTENSKLANTIKLVEGKLANMEKLTESKKEPFKSSEKAQIITMKETKTESDKVFDSIVESGNSILSKEILKLAGVKNGV